MANEKKLYTLKRTYVWVGKDGKATDQREFSMTDAEFAKCSQRFKLDLVTDKTATAGKK